jgi:hypothetical protein
MILNFSSRACVILGGFIPFNMHLLRPKLLLVLLVLWPDQMHWLDQTQPKVLQNMKVKLLLHEKAQENGKMILSIMHIIKVQ